VIDYRGRTGEAFSEPGTLMVKVDPTAPTSSLEWSGRTFTLTADDEGGSGVRLVEYSLDGGGWTPYVGPMTLDRGAHSVRHRALDSADNQGEVREALLGADPDGPAAAPVASSAPVISGTLRVGRRLTATSQWNSDRVTTSVQWTRDGVPIAGATGSSYVLTRADVRSRIGVVVTASRPGHATGVAQATRAGVVARATSRTRIRGLARSVRSGERVRLRLRVDVVGLAAEGRVRVFHAGKRVAVTDVTDGRAVVRFRAADPGRRTIRVRFLGDEAIDGSGTRATIRVR
jgi:hypothetical protein